MNIKKMDGTQECYVRIQNSGVWDKNYYYTVFFSNVWGHLYHQNRFFDYDDACIFASALTSMYNCKLIDDEGRYGKTLDEYPSLKKMIDLG
jgi:hypothetical protein